MIECNAHPSHLDAMITQKQRIRVTLDIECYDDLDLQSYDWNEVLGLEGDENVNITTENLDLDWQCARKDIGIKCQIEANELVILTASFLMS